MSLLARALEPADALDATEQRILDGALAEIAARGTEGATMDDVARRAGVGRMTVFRRFGTKDALIERLILRELRRFLAEVDERLAAIEDPGERVVEAFVACLRAGTGHPLMARMARVEPGLTMERLARGDPSPLEVGRLFVAERLRAQDVADADAAADVLVRLAASYALLPGPLVDVRDEAAARDFAERALAPIVRR
jgi:AcrR family transcriptional regulator